MTTNSPSVHPTERERAEPLPDRGENRGDEAVSPLVVLNSILENLQLFLVLPLVAAIFAVILGIVAPAEFTSRASFAGSSDEGTSNELASVASRFGLNAVSGRQVNLRFYAEMLDSRELLVQVASAGYDIEEGFDEPRSGNLMEVLDLEGSERERLNAAVGFLRESISSNVKQDAGVVEVEASAPSPELAEAINDQILEVLQAFSLERRRRQAGAERAFLERRLTEASEELRDAETAVTRFLEVNRRYENSPELSNELSQLRRRVGIRQEVYMALTNALDQARLQEAKDVPSIVVVDGAEGTARRSDLPPILNAALGGILGLVAAFLTVLIKGFFEKARVERPEEYAEMQARLRGIRSRLRR